MDAHPGNTQLCSVKKDKNVHVVFRFIIYSHHSSVHFKLKIPHMNVKKLNGERTISSYCT